MVTRGISYDITHWLSAYEHAACRGVSAYRAGRGPAPTGHALRRSGQSEELFFRRESPAERSFTSFRMTQSGSFSRARGR